MPHLKNANGFETAAQNSLLLYGRGAVQVGRARHNLPETVAVLQPTPGPGREEKEEI